MELYEADTQIDLLSETQGAAAAKASCVSETASEMTSSKPSTSSSLHTPSSHMISSTSSPPQQIRLPDGRSRNQEVFSDDMTDGKTRVYTDEEHQRTGASLLKESEVWSIEVIGKKFCIKTVFHISSISIWKIEKFSGMEDHNLLLYCSSIPYLVLK